MTQNNTIPVDQHGALDLRTFQKVPIDYTVNKDDKETSESRYEIRITSGKLAEDLNRQVNSSSPRLSRKRSFPTLNDGSFSYASINSDNVSPTLSNSSSSTIRQSCFIPDDFNLLENRGSSTPNDSSHDLSMNSMNDGCDTYGNFVQTLGNCSYASMNSVNVSETSNPSQHSKGPSHSIPHGTELDNIMNAEDATHGSMLQSSSELLGKRGSITMNDSSHAPIKKPLVELQSLCRSKEINPGIIRPRQEVKQGCLNGYIVTNLPQMIFSWNVYYLKC